MSIDLSSIDFAGITPADVRWYVLGRGWRAMQAKNKSVALYVLDAQDEQLQVPLAGDERDFRIMMTEVLRKLARVERRPLEEVTNDVRHPYEDVLRLRVFSLGEAEYNQACDAFRDHREIECTGVLRRGEQSKFYELRSPTDFRVAP